MCNKFEKAPFKKKFISIFKSDHFIAIFKTCNAKNILTHNFLKEIFDPDGCMVGREPVEEQVSANTNKRKIPFLAGDRVHSII